MFACSAPSPSTPSEPAVAAPDAAAPAEQSGAPDTTNAASESPDASTPAAPVDAGPPLDVPDSLIKALGTDNGTYVEENCQSTTYPGWPFAARRCTYQTNLEVVIANPTPERVARWIVEASSLIVALDGLKTRDRNSWESGLSIIAKHTIGQSSRIFPLDGQIYEDGTAYRFERGVTKTCSSGCYCRINSTSRAQWCAYAANVLKTETESTCLDRFGSTSKTLTEPWLQHCFDNHVASWESDRNEHYRAQAWAANESLSAQFPNPQSASPAAILTALASEYP